MLPWTIKFSANDRTAIDHWEDDLVKGKRDTSEPVIIRLNISAVTKSLLRLKIIHAKNCRQALQDVIHDFDSENFKTKIFDNGSEFTNLHQSFDNSIIESFHNNYQTNV